MKKSEFYLKKELLKTEISIHEKLLEEKFQTTINPQNMLLKVLPGVAKRFLNFEGKQLTSTFAEKINEVLINILTEGQKVIGGVTHIIKIFQELKDVIKNKKASTIE